MSHSATAVKAPLPKGTELENIVNHAPSLVPGMQAEGLVPDGHCRVTPETGRRAADSWTVREFKPYVLDALRRKLVKPKDLAAGQIPKAVRRKVDNVSSFINSVARLAEHGEDAIVSIALETAKDWVEQEAKRNRKPRECWRICCGIAETLPFKRIEKTVEIFAEVLAEELRKSGLSQRQLAKRCKINPAKIWKWLSRTNTPRADERTVGQVQQIEDVLNAENRLVPLLDPVPPEDTRPPKTPNAENDTTAYRFSLGKRPELWAEKGAGTLAAEFDAFSAAVRDESEPNPDRPSVIHWEDPKSAYKAENIVLIPGKRLRHGSLQAAANQVGQYFGFAKAWIAPEAAAFAYFVETDVLTKFYLFKKIRRANKGKSRTITNFDLDIVHLISKILKFIENDPSYSLKFKPVFGLVSAERVIEVRANWQQACALARIKLEAIYESEKENTAERENDEVRIEGILKSKRPLRALFAICDTLKAQLSKLPILSQCKTEVFKRRRANLLRDFFVIAAVLLPSAFRPGTGWRLIHSVDQDGNPSGNIQLFTSDDGKPILLHAVGKNDFKNFRSSILERGFRRKLLHLIDPSDVDLVLEYLFEARSVLSRGQKTDALIIRSGRFPRHTPRSFSEYVRRMTSRVMCKFPRPEYCGATRLSANQIRKILSTAVFKATGKMEEAKKAIASLQAAVYTHVEAEKLSESTETLLSDQACEWHANIAGATAISRV
jgi:transcriptional regulator with XRE-family HTH domain